MFGAHLSSLGFGVTRLVPRVGRVVVRVFAADVLSAVEFDETGQFLATGDKGGRIVVFERAESKVCSRSRVVRLCFAHVTWCCGGSVQSNGRGAGRGAGRRRNTCEYRFFTEFQSHEAEFDYLKSLEIEEKINQIRWCKSSNSALFLLSTNGALACPPQSETSAGRSHTLPAPARAQTRQ